MAREYFCAYHSYLKQIRKLSDAECGRLFRALLQYSAGEVDTLINLQGREEIAFDFICAQIDRDAEAYEEKCQKAADNISKRWKGKKQSIPTHTNDTDAYGRIPSDTDVYQTYQEKEEEKEEECIPPISPQGDGAGGSSQAKPRKRQSKPKPEKKPYGAFSNVLLTDDEHAKLTPAEMELIEELSGYIASSGRRYASHYATLLNWARRRAAEAGSKGHNNGSFAVEDLDSVVEVL